MKRFLLLLASMAFLVPLLAQEGESYLQLTGQVFDASTGKPLHYVSIGLVGTSVSNVSNADGLFTLKVDIATPPSAIVSVSHLGYAAVTLKVSDFEGFTEKKPLRIELQPISLQLPGALIRSLDPDDLIHAALHRIKDNYPTERVGMTAFYRELVRKGSGKYLNMNEAILDIDKAPYDSWQSDWIGIYKGRGSQNYDSSDTLFIKYQGGVYGIIQIDQAKNPFATANVTEIEKIYDFFSEPAEYMGERMFHVVSFQQKPGVEEIYMRGKVFIDSETLAIGRVEMWMNVEGREDAVSMYIIKRPPGVRFEVKSAEYVVNYKPYGNKWYYDYAKIELKFETRRRRSLFRHHYTVMSEIAVTEHLDQPKKIAKDARVKFKDQLTEKVSAFTDEDFWEDYNVIEPDAQIEAIVRRIVKQLRKQHKE